MILKTTRWTRFKSLSTKAGFRGFPFKNWPNNSGRTSPYRVFVRSERHSYWIWKSLVSLGEREKRMESSCLVCQILSRTFWNCWSHNQPNLTQRFSWTFSCFSCPRGDMYLRTHPTKDEACGRGVRAPGAPSCNDKKHGFNCHYVTLCLTRWPLPVRENQPHCGWYQHRAQNPPSSSPTSHLSSLPPLLFLFFLVKAMSEAT